MCVLGQGVIIKTYGVATISRLLKIITSSFAKEPYKRDCILQKRPIISRGLLIVDTPYAENCVITERYGIDMSE